MARTSLGPRKFILDMSSSSHCVCMCVCVCVCVGGGGGGGGGGEGGSIISTIVTDHKIPNVYFQVIQKYGFVRTDDLPGY